MERPATDLSDTKNNEPSVESPYTSIGSVGTSYNGMLSTHGINVTNGTNVINGMNITSGLNNITYSGYAKSHNGRTESRAKSVMDALQRLRTKIQKIEGDRSSAEINLKYLALETKGYKELLKQKQDLDGNMDGVLKDSQSKELEGQLEHAQGRCTVLEKQLESMRKVMKRPSVPKIIASVREPRTPAKEVERPRTHFSLQKSANESFTIDTSPIEKLNNLEKEHERLIVMQSQTENKINKLEEKIQKEVHHRKLLQHETKELQTVSGTKKKIDGVPASTQQLLKRKKGRKGSKSTISEAKLSISHSSDKLRTPPSHYLVDFSNIPFVVGQSTSKSHSLGANVQNVLSIMKSHNMLCCDESSKSYSITHAKSKAKQSPLVRSCKHLQDLLLALQDEFAQLGYDQREVISQLQSTSKTRSMMANLEQERDKIMERMEAKANQIHIICDHLEKVQLIEDDNRRQKHKNEKVVNKSSDIVEAASTVRRSPEVMTNPNLDMYKKVKKLQSTLCKHGCDT